MGCMTQNHLSPIAWILLLALGTVWGGSFYWAEIALRELGPLTIVAIRVGGAALFLGALLKITGTPFPKGARPLAAFALMGLLNNAIPFSLIVWGQSQIDSGLAAILNATTAVFGAVCAGLLLADERLTGPKIIGAVFGVLGVATIMGPGPLTSLSPTDLGQLAILGAALSYALASVWGKLSLSGNAPLANAFGMTAAATVWMVPTALVAEGMPALPLSPQTWAALAGLSVLATVVAYLLYFEILRRAGAANLMLVTLLVPAVAILLGWSLLDETLSATAWIGFGLIAIGLVCSDGRMLKRRCRATSGDAPSVSDKSA